MNVVAPDATVRVAASLEVPLLTATPEKLDVRSTCDAGTCCVMPSVNVANT